MFKDIVNLVSFVDDTNALGDPIKVPLISGNIFADRKSIKQSEFYQAAAVGLKPEFTFVIRTIEYNQEPALIFNLKQCSMIRTFETQDEFIELVCQGQVNGAI